jgi:hypothetical protein
MKIRREERIAREALHDPAQAGRLRPEREGQDRHHDRRLGQRGHRDLAAGAHAPERAAGVEAGQGEEEGAEDEEVHEEHEAGEVEDGPREQQGDDEGRHHHGGEQHVGREAEDPRGRRGDDRFLAEALDEIGVRLEHAGATPADETRLQRAESPDEQGRPGRHDDDLDHGQDDVGGHRSTRSTSSTTKM